LNIGVATASRMGYEDRQYHRQREEQCRMMAELARNPDIRRRHEGLAGLHAARAPRGDASAGASVS
jgi:hypothetical protein